VPGAGETFIVEFERANRGATTGRETDNFHTVIAPPNVCTPDVSAWIEQERFFSSLRVDGVRSGALGTVTQRAGQPKILLSGCSTRSEGNEMFDMHRHGGYALGREAIATTVWRIRHHFST
jgi:hypothetical protein